jgi:2-keto-4-pentenoate hydratase/2-oxohepta-3-ene-1,7-dioic acid hydratase in catechol pathway
MRLVTYANGAGPAAGVLDNDEVVPVGALDAPANSVRELLSALGADELATLGEQARHASERIALDNVRLLAPVPDPQKIICLGLNYRDHAEEAGQEPPAAPLWFAKFPNSLIGSGGDIVLPAAHPEYVDYEAELAVVIGRDGAPAGAMPFNDVSARDLQLQNPLWTSGKAVDTFAPCGPALVTLDDAGDLGSLGVSTKVNGELLQHGNTRDLIFGVTETVTWLSRTMTLLPGDIIATGTPAGIGAVQGRFLRDGDLVEVEVDGLGTLANRVRLTPSPRP